VELLHFFRFVDTYQVNSSTIVTSLLCLTVCPNNRDRRARQDKSPMFPIPNVVLFGSGKSSIINMISESPPCQAAQAASGGAHQRVRHRWTRRARFDFGDRSDFCLLKSLDTGVSFLVFCMRGPRIKDTAHGGCSMRLCADCSGDYGTSPSLVLSHLTPVHKVLNSRPNNLHFDSSYSSSTLYPHQPPNLFPSSQ